MIKHGECRNKISRLYRIWSDMLTRVNYKSFKHYKNYGGRGISICPEWYKAANFIKWAKNNGYSDDLVLDRINNNGNYEPSNCRFVTYSQSNINRRKRADFGIFRQTPPKNKYYIQLVRNGKRYHHGAYLELEEARIKRDELLEKLDKMKEL